MIDRIIKGGAYTTKSSSLYVKIHNVYFVNKKKDYIKVKISLRRKSNGSICEKPTTYKLVFSTVTKTWERYKDQ